MADTATSSVPTEIVSAPASDATSASYPPCARTCLADATSSLPCPETDSACLCLHASTVQSSVTSCLNTSNACSASEAASAASYYDELCVALGYPTSDGESTAAVGPIVTASGAPSPISTHLPSATASQSSSSTTSTSSSSQSTLSVPAIAGIAAGATFLVVCIVTLLAFLYIRRNCSKPTNPTVTIESRDPSNPNGRLRRTVSLRQSALYSPEPEFAQALSRIQTLSGDEKPEYNFTHLELERKKSLPQTPNTPGSAADTLTNNSFVFNAVSEKDLMASLPTLPRPAASTTKTTINSFASPPPSSNSRRAHSPPSPTTTTNYQSQPRTRTPPITFLPSKHLFEASVTCVAVPASRRISVTEKSPAATEFSEVASFYSATSSQHSRTKSKQTVSEVDEEAEAAEEGEEDEEVQVAHASTLIMQRSRPTTLEALSGPVEYTSSIQPRTTKPPPLRISTQATNSTSSSSPNPPPQTTMMSPGSVYSPTTNSTHPKVVFNPLTQNPSPTTSAAPRFWRPTSSALASPALNGKAVGESQSPTADSTTFSQSSFGKFNFELASPKSMEGFRASFTNYLDFDFEKGGKS